MTGVFGLRRWAFVLALIASALLRGRVSADDKPVVETRTAILVTDKDDGKTVTIADKQHLIVALAFNAGTPYEWQLKETPKELRFIHHYIIQPLDAQPIGGTRLAGFDFGPEASGTCALEFELVAADGKIAKTVKFTAKVAKSE